MNPVPRSIHSRKYQRDGSQITLPLRKSIRFFVPLHLVCLLFVFSFAQSPLVHAQDSSDSQRNPTPTPETQRSERATPTSQPTRSEAPTPTSQPTRPERPTPTSQPTRSERPTPTSQPVKVDRTKPTPESVKTNPSKPTLNPVNVVPTMEVSKRPMDTKSATGAAVPVTIAIKEQILLNYNSSESVNNQRNTASVVDSKTKLISPDKQSISINEKLEIFIGESDANEKSTDHRTGKATTDESATDCAMNSGGQSSLNIFGLLLSPVFLHLWRKCSGNRR